MSAVPLVLVLHFWHPTVFLHSTAAFLRKRNTSHGNVRTYLGDPIILWDRLHSSQWSMSVVGGGFLLLDNVAIKKKFRKLKTRIFHVSIWHKTCESV